MKDNLESKIRYLDYALLITPFIGGVTAKYLQSKGIISNTMDYFYYYYPLIYGAYASVRSYFFLNKELKVKVYSKNPIEDAKRLKKHLTISFSLMAGLIGSEISSFIEHIGYQFFQIIEKYL